MFLSMLDSEEYVSEAFRCGGRGYVLKPLVGRDLTSALHHVPMAGYLFQRSCRSFSSRMAAATLCSCTAIQFRSSTDLPDSLTLLFGGAMPHTSSPPKTSVTPQ